MSRFLVKSIQKKITRCDCVIFLFCMRCWLIVLFVSELRIDFFEFNLYITNKKFSFYLFCYKPTL
ncbi:TPA_asm: hypothetical protein GEJ83_06155 [Listeria monocytogenes]|nr:hypothetical protein [Listeria monocytogenes]HAA3370629.1 hypothetical protein [Listeria monocytogenes]HAA6314826.1 hypothetical protein [Listeria monocytogenes]HAA6425862.1 hypothetical protein [Listeria monocytogenes]